MKRRVYQITLIIIMIFCTSISITTMSKNNTRKNILIEKINNISISQQQVIIDKMEDGFGLKLYIINIGDQQVNNMILKREIVEGPRPLFFRNNIKISSLQPGEIKKITLNVIGFCHGIFDSYPMITFTIESPDIITYDWGIIARVTGPFIKIIGNYFDSPYAYNGYTFFSPEHSTKSYLIDNSGRIIHQWKSEYIEALGNYLLEDSSILRTTWAKPVNRVFFSGGIGGRVEIIDWNSNLVWEFQYSNETVCLHHDVEMLPNGNILMISWEYKSPLDVINAGRDLTLFPTDEIWIDHIIEVKPIGKDKGEIVWEWHLWDHLIQDYDPIKMNYGNISNHPELININYVGNYYQHGKPDFTHTNSIDYNEEFDQILLSSHNFNEIWVIDHSTTTTEASGHTGGRYGKGGDLLYRWGNPRTYNRGGKDDQILFGQHDTNWIEGGLPGYGHILIFNNGIYRPSGNYSSVIEIIPPVNQTGYYFLEENKSYGPNDIFWQYTDEDAPFDFFSIIISGAQRLPNGNTLICEGVGGFFFEVTNNKQIVWFYTNQFPNLTINGVYIIRRYPIDYIP